MKSLLRMVGPAVWVGALVLAGCHGAGQDPYAGYDLGQAQPVVASAVDAMGGLEAWRAVEEIHARAVVKTYDADGRAYVTEQTQTVELGRGGDGGWWGWGGDEAELSMTAPVSGGTWEAMVSSEGERAFESTGAPVAEHVRRLHLDALDILLHRLHGPLNLLGGGERIQSVRPRSIENKTYTRVGLMGRSDVVAYYFDPDSRLLRYVTAGTDEPGSGGTITLYEYRRLSNGLVFPVRIRVMQTGEYVLIGQRPILEVEYLEVTMQ